MKIQHTKTITDGAEEEYLRVEVPDRRYASSFTEIEISLEQATILSKELDIKLSGIPY